MARNRGWGNKRCTAPSAHRRQSRRFDAKSLGLQAFLTGTDEMLFDGLTGRAQGFRVEAAGLSAVG